MHGYIVIKTNLTLLELNAKVGTFGLWRPNMSMWLRSALYALLGFVLAESGVTLSEYPVNFCAIILIVIMIDVFANRSNV